MPVSYRDRALRGMHEYIDEIEKEADDLRIEVERLRAALAARPQPLFEGTMLDMEDWVHSYDSVDALQRVVVYPAVAGSATPTQEATDAVLRRLWDGWRPLPRKAQWSYTKPGYADDEREPMTEAERSIIQRLMDEAAAGSATPTRTDDE